MSIFDSLERRDVPDQWVEIQRRSRTGDEVLSFAEAPERRPVVALAVGVAFCVAIITSAVASRGSGDTDNPTIATTTAAPTSCREQVPKPLSALGVSSTVVTVDGGATVALRNDSAEAISVSDSRVLVPLGADGAVIGSAITTDVYIPPTELKPGQSLTFGSPTPGQIATSDCTIDASGGKRQPITDGVYDFVYLVSIMGNLYKSEPISLSATRGEVRVTP